MFGVRDNADGQPYYVSWGKQIHSFKFVKGLAVYIQAVFHLVDQF